MPESKYANVWISLMLIVMFYNAAGQVPDVLEISMKKVEGIEPFYTRSMMATTQVPDDSLYRFVGIPNIVTADYRIWRLDLDLDQNLHERFINGIATAKEIERHDKLNTTYVYDGMIKHDIHIMTGIHESEKFVIVDSDNDLNFANNRVHIFDIDAGPRMSLEQWNKEAPVFMLNYERFDGENIVNERALMQLFPFSADYEFDKRHAISTGQFEHYVGAFEIAGHKYSVAMNNGPFTGNFRFVDILWADSMDRFMPNINRTNNVAYAIGDMVYFGDYRYQILNVKGFGEKLVLNFIDESPPPHLGFREGYFIEPLKVHTIDDRQIEIANGGKYFLVHFWGLWCHNCLENLPKLRDMVSELPRDRVDVLGVCVDSEAERAEIGARVYKMDWNISFEYFEPQTATREQEIAKVFNVRRYPSYFLISPEGEIIKRVGSKDLNEIKVFFEKLE